MIEDKRITVKKERARRVDRSDVLSGDFDPRVVLEGVGRGSARSRSRRQGKTTGPERKRASHQLNETF
jgi:hypothetical protein